LLSKPPVIIDRWVIMSRTADPTAKISLLRAAEEVFAEKGVDGAKVEDIARAAGISKGAFYLHFESKEAVLKQVVESFLGRMGAQFVLPATLPETPEALLAFWLARDTESFEFLWQSRAILGILQTCSGDYHYLLDAFRKECRATVAKWIDLLKERDLVRKEVDAEVTATLMNGAYNELVLMLLAQKTHPDFDKWLAIPLDVFVRGIGSPRLIVALEKHGVHKRRRAARAAGKKSGIEVQR
jgi:AcrR family transcriptional regulator